MVDYFFFTKKKNAVGRVLLQRFRRSVGGPSLFVLSRQNCRNSHSLVTRLADVARRYTRVPPATLAHKEE